MKAWVTNLLALQETDLRLRQLHDRLELLPRELARLEGELDAGRAQVEAAKTELKTTELGIRQVETELKAELDAIQRLQGQSVNVKKNEEYRALIHEVDHHKAKISQHETRQLEHMEQVDAVKVRLRQAEAALAEQTGSVTQEKTEFKDLAGKLQGEIARLKEGRKPLAAVIKEDILAQYERLLKRGGIPLAKVENGNCGNCHLRLTPQTANEGRKGNHVPCDNCGHLLYVED